MMHIETWGIECPISNSRSEAETGLSEAKAVTEGNGNEYPTEQVCERRA
jgi:hypothetical protein